MPRARLEVTDAVGSRIVPVDKDRFQIGRRSSHDLHLGGADVSRDHAEITRNGDRFTLKDRGSRCGTFVNGEPIAERALEHGDRIHVGRGSGADLIFLSDDAGASALSAPAATGRDLHQIATLLDALRALGSGRVLDEVLALVLDSALVVTGAERGFIMLADAAGRLEFKLGRDRHQITLPGLTFATSQKIPEEVFATGEPLAVPDLLEGGLKDDHVGTIALGIRHVLSVPLKLVRYVDAPADAEQPRQVEQPTRIGVLYLDGRDKGTLLSRETRAALETLAAEAALAIDNARLYRDALEKARLEQQMTIGAQIQRALLPRAHHSGEGFELACASLPCLAIGGDFFDYLDLPGGGFGFVLGDVSGKGLPAALLTAVVQGIFAIEASLDHPPAEALARLNETLIRKAVQGRFATLFYGVLSRDGRLTYTNAGHNPPLVLGRSGLRRLSTGGTIVGIFPEASYEQETITLDPGDLVIVFSDGVTEAFNADWEEFGDARLIESVRENAALPPAALLEKVMTAVRGFVKDAVQSDDVSVLVLRYLS
jgi:sigma-B regulation protein RsbU (phosphoserine phosphatase)